MHSQQIVGVIIDNFDQNGDKHRTIVKPEDFAMFDNFVLDDFLADNGITESEFCMSVKLINSISENLNVIDSKIQHDIIHLTVRLKKFEFLHKEEITNAKSWIKILCDNLSDPKKRECLKIVGKLFNIDSETIDKLHKNLYNLLAQKCFKDYDTSNELSTFSFEILDKTDVIEMLRWLFGDQDTAYYTELILKMFKIFFDIEIIDNNVVFKSISPDMYEFVEFIKNDLWDVFMDDVSYDKFKLFNTVIYCDDESIQTITKMFDKVRLDMLKLDSCPDISLSTLFANSV